METVSQKTKDIMELITAVLAKFSAFFNALLISFFASGARYVFEKNENKSLKGYLGFWFLASFVVYIATLAVSGFGLEGNFAMAIVGLSGFAARELLELFMSILVKVSPVIAKRMKSIIDLK